MSVRIEETTREQVADFVPKAIQKAVDSYYKFMDLTIEAEAKKFSEHHTAGKVAIAHIQLLLKLAQWADVDTGDSGANAEYLLKAQDETNAHRAREVPHAERDDF